MDPIKRPPTTSPTIAFLMFLVLHPRLSKTSFGTVGDSIVWASVMYTIERPSFSAPLPDFDYVAYPSQRFDYAYSVTFFDLEE